MNGKYNTNRLFLSVFACLTALAGAVACVTLPSSVATAEDQRIIGPQRGHVEELSDYLDRVEIYAPIHYEHLAVFPVRVREGELLPGSWLTLDQALAKGNLVVHEKGGGRVPVVVVENRSDDDLVFIMGGEVLAGGKQTRTVRNDVVLSPGERVELQVFCVEQRRWHGESAFKASGTALPQSIQQALRQGADQQKIWAEVARNNRALDAENTSGSLELALNSVEVKGRLAVVRDKILPDVPRDTVGFIFVSGHRALGADFFGQTGIAKTLLPKLLDSYAVDSVLQHRGKLLTDAKTQESVALSFFDRIVKAGSQRVGTPGSGAGIRTRRTDLMGDGISLSGVLVHFGVQARDRIIIPVPMPQPMIPERPVR